MGDASRVLDGDIDGFVREYLLQQGASGMSADGEDGSHSRWRCDSRC